jgi:hypothetical protein
MSLLFIIEHLHTLLFLLILIPYITNNKKILLMYFYFLIFVYICWGIFNGECFLSIIEKKLNKDKVFNKNNGVLQNRIKTLFNIDINEKILDKWFWIINYLSILALTYKLKRLYFGIIWIIMWQIYATLFLEYIPLQ